MTDHDPCAEKFHRTGCRSLLIWIVVTALIGWFMAWWFLTTMDAVIFEIEHWHR